MKLVLGGRIMLCPPVDFQNNRGQAIGDRCMYSLNPEAQKAIRAGVRKLSEPFAAELAAAVVRARPNLDLDETRDI